MPPLRFKEPNTPQLPYSPRRAAKPGAVHSGIEWERYKDWIIDWFRENQVSKVVEKLSALGFEARFSASQSPSFFKILKMKYLKFTDGQLEYITEQVAKRQLKGEKAALRLNGTKIPSKKMAAAIKRRSDILRKVVSSVTNIDETENEKSPQIDGFASIEPGDDPDESIMTKALSRAPSVIDSLRITVYTSSTVRGIRGLFSMRPKPLLEAEDEADDKGFLFWIFQQPETIVDPSLANRMNWDALALKALFPDLKIRLHRGTGDVGVDMPLMEQLRLQIRRHIDARYPRVISRLDLEPEVAVNNDDNVNMFVISQDKMWTLRHIGAPYYPNLRGGYVRWHLKNIQESFERFLADRSKDQHLFRRRININDCPEGVWAVDVSELMYHAASMYSRENRNLSDRLQTGHSCLAWCTRSAKQWNEWISRLVEVYKDQSWIFACGHRVSDLVTDGPVIFTDTLEWECWASDGCQSGRLDTELQEGSSQITGPQADGDENQETTAF